MLPFKNLNYFLSLSFAFSFNLSHSLGRIQKPLHQLRGNVAGAAAWRSQSRNICEGSNNALYRDMAPSARRLRLMKINDAEKD